jgi:hypothetical protein
MKTQTLKQTMIRSSYFACFILSTVLFLPSCKKTGPSPTPTPTPVAFKNVQVNGSCIVTLAPGATNQVNSSAVSVTTFIWGNTLMVSGSGTINISVNTLDTLTSLGSNVITSSSALNMKKILISCAGSSDSLSINLNTIDSVTVLASGQGKYYLSGNTPKLAVTELGNANFYGYNLISKNCNVTTIGSGDAQVYVTGTLSGLLIGSGNVYYKGNPTKVSPFILGSGKAIPQ